ncbi:MAG TPA: TonB-dependent siderophore receptor [Vicinamibacterales bacterium]|nr:TonB-dependent siderophore receptor [Vicinamibacterales bacterium]
MLRASFVVFGLLAAGWSSSLSAAPALRGQAAAITARGLVVDPSQAPIVGATITAQAAAGGTAIVVRSDGQGRFALTLTPGTYTVRIAAPGFAAIERTITTSDPGSIAREYVLSIEGVTDTVEVIGPSPYAVHATGSATKTPTPLRDVPQAVTVVTRQLIEDQMMLGLGDVFHYVPGAQQHQGESNRDEVVLRGNDSSSSFYVDGVRDDVQYYRDLYDVERVEVIKGPNALLFGRGGAGGVVNRVTKQAYVGSNRTVGLEGGSFGAKRVTTDLDTALSPTLAVRFNGMYENSGSFRDHVGLERYGLSPTLTWTPSANTTVTLGYNHLWDRRTADRGVSSFEGRPVSVPVSTYFGNPDDSHVRASVHLTNATIEHRSGAFTIRNHTLVGAYGRGYQNFVPGAVSPDGAQLTLTAYNNATARMNVFNQTDVTWRVATGRLHHTVLAGAEAGLQLTDNFRNTGYFGDGAASTIVSVSAPTIDVPATFRQSATDADNHLTTKVGAMYAQDQIALSDQVQVVAGLRLDRFDLTYHNNRSGDTLERVDDLLSPRGAVIYEPVRRLSLYTSYAVSYLPSSGDQFSSLTTITEQVKPEQFSNYEAGVKWDTAGGLSMTADVYRLDRTNTRSTDPADPTRIVQTGSQRTDGFEVGVNGRVTAAWSVAGGYSYQKAWVTSATAAAPAGAIVGQVPHQMFSLWNRYQVQRRLAVALGIIERTDMFAKISDAVVLPGYTRADVAAFWTFTPRTRLQVNIENLFDERYFLDADSDTNISPGSPRSIRIGLVTGF